MNENRSGNYQQWCIGCIKGTIHTCFNFLNHFILKIWKLQKWNSSLCTALICQEYKTIFAYSQYFFTFLVSLLADKYAARVFNGNKSAGLPELISSRTIPYFLSARYARYRKISLSTARSGSEIELDGFYYRNFERDLYREFKLTRLKKYFCFLPEVRNFCASLIQDW